ncbi:zinc metalloproteinase nas-4 isoform X2 [Folsomia candida]|uniref:zinc metalloproteinase nas-4 isoform X2 n=1 Tax=Folsomia candida TaxID=158441 RepID=UPI001604DAC6|nr:zinc metalloproteinase nas-4 isoform X2 [Folsomia candida]
MEIHTRFLLFLLYVTICLNEIVSTNAESDPLEYLQSVNRDHPVGAPLTVEDFENGDKLVSTPPTTASSDPIHLANLYEGDIAMTSTEFLMQKEKNAVILDKHKWNRGIVPYTISADFVSDERATIARAMSEYHAKSCIRFKPKSPQSSDRDYLAIVKGQGCSSHVGRLGNGEQILSLGAGCVSVGIALHEMMHALGFWHEQSRPDRDQYVTVYYENIKEGMAYNFHKQSWANVQNLSRDYDTGSIMHYGAYAFSKGKGLPTILPKNPNEQIGQRREFTVTDIKKINTLYKCPQTNQEEDIADVQATEKPSSSTGCQDNGEHCKYWSEHDECERNPKYMKVYCRKSCNFCGDCHDSNRHCNYWASIGECTKNPSYMKSNCKKACKTC